MAADVHQDQALIDFIGKPGKTTEYKNAKRQDCSITRREGQEGALEFSLFDYADKVDGVEQVGNTLDSYLLTEAGDILVAEHRLLEHEDKPYKFSKILINLEELLHKIDTDFRPAPQNDSN